MSDDAGPQNKIILYQAENGKVRVEVEFDGDTVWLSQALMADLYQTTPQNITQHIREIYRDGECSEEATCKESLQVRLEGQRRVRRSIKLYNLTMIMAVGFRVRSERGVLFRQWAVERLREYALKGFALDDERLKAGGGGLYFDELLARIRDIRSSEKIFWKKVLDIYATSIDYDPRAEASQAFFATVQNKMHWAIHGHTAAELVVSRIDPESPNLGMTNWPGTALRKSDASIAKNYLTEEELDALNRIVTAYLEFA
ncbi:MAG: RhuM family protein, partial [Candidatus Paceibacterota bacterium]